MRSRDRRARKKRLYRKTTERAKERQALERERATVPWERPLELDNDPFGPFPLTDEGTEALIQAWQAGEVSEADLRESDLAFLQEREQVLAAEAAAAGAG